MVSERDKRMMRILGEDLRRAESNDRGTPEQWAAVIAWVNRRRAKDGRPPLEDKAPEEGFYERARSSAWLEPIVEIFDDLGLDWTV